MAQNVKTETLACRVDAQTKTEFINNSVFFGFSSQGEFLATLIENHQIFMQLSNFKGILLPLDDAQAMKLTQIADENEISLLELIENQIKPILDDSSLQRTPENVNTTFTDSSIQKKSVNETQNTGLQAFTNVNEAVNEAVNDRKHESLRKNQLAVYENSQRQLLQLLYNSRDLIDYCLPKMNNMFSKQNREGLINLLYQNCDKNDIMMFSALLSQIDHQVTLEANDQ